MSQLFRHLRQFPKFFFRYVHIVNNLFKKGGPKFSGAVYRDSDASAVRMAIYGVASALPCKNKTEPDCGADGLF